MIKMVKRGKKKVKRFVNKYGYRDGMKVTIAKAWYKFIGRPTIKILKKMINKGNDHYIVMESRPDFTDNARALYDYMIEKNYNKKYHIIWLVDSPEFYKEYRCKNVKFVRKFGKYHRSRTVAAYYYTLKSKYVIFTHACRWVEKKNKNQMYLNLWHGCGYKAAREEEGMTNVFDYCLVPGDVFVETKKQFFCCGADKILALGYPRYNLLKKNNPKAKEFLNQLNPNAVKNILWMPTFRDSEQLLHYEDPIPAIIGFPLMRTVYDFQKLDELSRAAKVNLIIKWHRNSSHCNGEKVNYTNVFYLDNDDLAENNLQLYELIGETDALITDFSSVAIDYLLLDKSIGFTMDDYDDYERTRGFVFEDAKKYMPGTYMYNLEDLGRFLHDIAEGKDEFKAKRDAIMPETHNQTEDYCARILEKFGI